MRVRNLPIEMHGIPQRGATSRNAKPVAAEYGWLTPLRQSKGDTTRWFFRCRCGTEIARELKHIRRLVKRGAVPRCGAGCVLAAQEVSA